jgi:hypothetical protein
MGLCWGVGAGFIALLIHMKVVEVVSWGGGAVPLRLQSAVNLVLVAEGERRVGENVAGMAEQNESGIWGLMLLGLMWWLGWGLHS